MRSATYFYVLLACMASAAPAMAEDAGQEAATGDGAAAAAQAEDEDRSGTSLQEVVVVARQRAERLQDVPLSVSAVTAETVAAAGVTDARGLMYIVPGLVGGRSTASFQPVIRGVGTGSVALSEESNVALYIDGIYQPSHLANVTDFAEIERVEVLRGPQGTLFGRNATGGLINVITPDPKDVFQGNAKVDYTGFKGTGEYRTQVYVTGPIATGLSGNLSLNYRQNGNYIKDLVRGGNLGEGKSFVARAKLMFEPSDTARLVLSYTHVNRLTTEDNASLIWQDNSQAKTVPGAVFTSRPYTAALTFLPRSNGGQGVPESASRVDAIELKTRFDLGFANLETAHNFARDRTFQSGETDSASPMISSNYVIYKDKYYSNEVRLLSSGDGPFQWILGGYQFYLNGYGTVASFAGNAPTFVTFRTTFFNPDMATRSYAAFGEGNYAFNDRLSLTLGVRYSTERRSLDQTIGGVNVFKVNTGWVNKWTYRASALYEINNDTNVYATYSTGFKSGTYNSTQSSAAISATNPEDVTQIELGIKSDPLPWLRVNLSIFDSEYDDLQVSARTPAGLFQTFNAARAKIRGGEVEVQAFPTESLSLRAAVAVLDAKYSEFPTAQVFTPNATRSGNVTQALDVSGNNLLRAPKHTISVSGIWRREVAGGELTIAGNAYHSAKIYYDFANRLFQPAYTTLGGEIAWTTPDERLRFKVFGKNLTDKIIVSNLQSGATGDRVTFERPRQIGMGLEAKF